LIYNGTLAARNSEFDETEVALNSAVVRMSFDMLADAGKSVAGTPWAADLSWRLRSKLDMVIALLQEGWVPVAGPEPLTAEGGRQFLQKALKQTKAYLFALLNIDMIFAKVGAPATIYHDLPCSFYIALFTMEDLNPLGLLEYAGLKDRGNKDTPPQQR